MNNFSTALQQHLLVGGVKKRRVARRPRKTQAGGFIPLAPLLAAAAPVFAKHILMPAVSHLANQIPAVRRVRQKLGIAKPRARMPAKPRARARTGMGFMIPGTVHPMPIVVRPRPAVRRGGAAKPRAKKAAKILYLTPRLTPF